MSERVQVTEEQCSRLRAEALPRVARCINAPVEDLTIYRPHTFEGRFGATVYWGSLYICEAVIMDGTLVLHSWRRMYRDRGRLEYYLGEEV